MVGSRQIGTSENIHAVLYICVAVDFWLGIFLSVVAILVFLLSVIEVVNRIRANKNLKTVLWLGGLKGYFMY